MNASKSAVLLFSPDKSHHIDLHYRLNTVRPAGPLKYLEAVCNPPLQWAAHLNMFVTNGTKAMGIPRHCWNPRSVFQRNGLMMIYKPYDCQVLSFGVVFSQADPFNTFHNFSSFTTLQLCLGFPQSVTNNVYIGRLVYSHGVRTSSTYLRAPLSAFTGVSSSPPAT